MNARFPDRRTIHAVLSLATRAPSIHNSQPWRWRVGDESLHLYADPDRHLPNTDPDSRDLLLSCGASLHHAVVALAALGWQAKINRLPDPLHPAHLAAIEVYRHPASELDVALAAAIPRRRTDRRHYSWWPVPAADVALMGSRAARAGVMLRQVESLPKLQEHCGAGCLAACDRPGLPDRADGLEWAVRIVSGVPARNTPPSDPTSPIPGRMFAGPALAQPPDTEPADDGAVVLALGTKDDSRLARLRAGEATSLVSAHRYRPGTVELPGHRTAGDRRNARSRASDVFGVSGYPQMLLRVGWAPVNADPFPSTPRRPLGRCRCVAGRFTAGLVLSQRC